MLCFGGTIHTLLRQWRYVRHTVRRTCGEYNHTLGIVHHAGTVIRSVVIFAEGLFEGESYVVWVGHTIYSRNQNKANTMYWNAINITKCNLVIWLKNCIGSLKKHLIISWSIWCACFMQPSMYVLVKHACYLHVRCMYQATCMLQLRATCLPHACLDNMLDPCM